MSSATAGLGLRWKTAHIACSVAACRPGDARYWASSGTTRSSPASPEGIVHQLRVRFAFEMSLQVAGLKGQDL